MISFLRSILPIGPYEPKHWLAVDRRGGWVFDVCVVAVWAVYVAFVVVVMLR